MKLNWKMYSLFLSIIISASMACTRAEKPVQNTDNEQVEIYDSLKASAFGADEYGMKTYVMAFLKRGPNRSTDAGQAAALQKAHLKNIGRLAKEGKLVVAGPFLDSGDIRGIYIFNVSSLDEAEILTKTDPAIQAGTLEMELRLWYGSAALVEVNDFHKVLAKKSFDE